MSSYIVNASTSVVLIDSTQIAPGNAAVVYLSSQVPPGRTVTVRDSTGFLSTPQAIRVSTAGGVLFADGTSSIQISEPYASMSFSSRGATSWDIINTFGFPLYATVASVSSLTTSTLVGTNLNITGPLIANSVEASTLRVMSTGQVDGPLFVSTLVVGPPSTILSPPYVTIPGYAAYVLGPAYISSSTVIQGPLTVSGPTTVQSNLTIGGNLVVGQSLAITGNLNLTGNLVTDGTGSITCQTFSTLSSATILGNAILNSNVFVTSNLQVGGAMTTTTVTASTFQVNTGGFIQFGTGGGPTLRARTDILPGQTFAAFNAPIFTPYLSAQTIQATTFANVSSLNVTGRISAPTLSQFLLSSAAITNPNGSLAIDTITANSLTLSNVFAVTTLQTSNLVVSTATVTGNLVGGATTTLSTARLLASSIQTTTLSTGNLFAGSIVTPAIGLSSIFVASSIIGGPSFTTLSIPSATIQNSQGTIQAGTLTASNLSTSSLLVQTGAIRSGSTLQFLASSVTMSNAAISSLFVSSFQTSTLTVSRIRIGDVPGSSNGPDFYYQPVPTPSTNVLVTGGPGDYLNPYTVSNVKPPAQPPATPYTTYISFQADYKSQPVPPGMVIGYSATLLWAGQSNSVLQLANGAGPTLFGLFGSDQTVTGTIQRSTFEIAATLYGNSAIQVTFQFQYSPNPTTLNSNCVVEFNNGILNWNYSLNGTTIQNSLNDISTRNLYYYGGLSFASDPRLKTNIQDADLDYCYELIRGIPLRTYRYNETYCSTFGLEAVPRLGFLATELQTVLPQSVRPVEGLLPGSDTSYLTIDTSQLEMAQFGATQLLMKKVAQLEQELEALIRADMAP